MSNNTLGVIFQIKSRDIVHQVIAVPAGNADGSLVWTRENDSRTRWQRVNVDVVKRLCLPGVLTHHIAAFVVSEKVAREITTSGWSYSMPTIALRSLERSPMVTVQNADVSEADITSIFTTLKDLNTPVLNGILINDKRVNPVNVVTVESLSVPAPVVPTVATPVVAPVASEPKVSVVEDDTFNAVLLPPSYADRYESRLIHGVRDFDVFDAALARSQNVLLGGDTGAGKTIAVKAWAAARGLRVAQVTGNPQNDAYRIMGKQVLDNGTSRFQPGLLHELFRFGGVLLLDEVDLNTDGFLSELFPTLRERVLTLHDSAGETLFAHDQFIVFATMNGTRGYRRRELDAAMKNRFTHIIDWRYDPEVERRLGVVPSVADLADGIRKQFYQEEITTPLPTNALLDFQTIAQDVNLNYAIGNFIARFARDEQEAISITLSGIYSNLKKDLNLQ